MTTVVRSVQMTKQVFGVLDYTLISFHNSLIYYWLESYAAELCSSNIPYKCCLYGFSIFMDMSALSRDCFRQCCSEVWRACSSYATLEGFNVFNDNAAWGVRL